MSLLKLTVRNHEEGEIFNTYVDTLEIARVSFSKVEGRNDMLFLSIFYKNRRDDDNFFIQSSEEDIINRITTSRASIQEAMARKTNVVGRQ